MTGHAWSPGAGHETDPRQVPPHPMTIRPDGTVTVGLWAPSEGPCRPEVGGAGGEPEGWSTPIRKVSWD